MEPGYVPAGEHHAYAWEFVDGFEIEHSWKAGGPPLPDSGVYDSASSLWSAVMLPIRPGAYGMISAEVEILALGGSENYVKNLGWLGGDLTQPWEEAGNPWATRRFYLNATLLPTGHVFVNGGTTDAELRDDGGVDTAEIYNPRAETWLVNDATTGIVRNYHSVSLLLPDGRVWIAGSNPDAAKSGNDGSNRELRMEVFEPWYYGRADRPAIDGLSRTRVRPNDTFRIETDDAADIREVVLLRPGSVTHSFNGDQRLVELSILSRDAGSIEVQAPFHYNLTPPGHYMVFVLRDGNDPRGLVPSEAAWVQIDMP